MFPSTPNLEREDASYLPQAYESSGISAKEAGDIAPKLSQMLDTCPVEEVKVMEAGTNLHVDTVKCRNGRECTG
jgi:hypothetical protein